MQANNLIQRLFQNQFLVSNNYKNIRKYKKMRMGYSIYYDIRTPVKDFRAHLDNS